MLIVEANVSGSRALAAALMLSEEDMSRSLMTKEEAGRI
jgi:hypothetical protein